MAGNGKVFVSHAHVDNALCDRYVAALRARGLDVWYDRQDMQAGHALTTEIERELQARSSFVVILTPASIQSFWVKMEIAAFRDLLSRDPSRLLLPVRAANCDVPLLLRGVKWVDAERVGFDTAIGEISNALGLPPATPSIPPDRFPPRLAQLGYQGMVLGGAEVIVPPLCSVSAGAFLMGTDPAQDKQFQSMDKQYQDREKPQHWVTLPGFPIARFPVTVAEYACFVRTGHAEPASPFNNLTWQQQRERPDHPVVNVSWNDALAYAAWLAKQTGQPWRLPSEAEWEKAARWDERSRSSRIYPWGDSFDKARCNTHEGGKGVTTPVGSYPNGASPCGAQEMAGNVWEWTSSLYKSYPYHSTDGRESANSTDDRVLRGGSWLSDAARPRAAFRLDYAPDDVDGNYGFRLVRAAGE